MNYKYLWDSASALKATGGKGYGEWKANNICVDSRRVQHGDIFIAFKGEHTDGHKFVKEALQKASVAIVEKIPENCDTSKHNLIVVPDSLKALNDMAVFNRDRSKAKIIAVTGSVGKTSTKEQLRCAFSRLGKVYSSYGNYNSYVGARMSLASMPLDVEYGIFELGMSYSGEITVLTKITRPDISIITTIAPVHIENFDSIEGIAKAKAEIFLGMTENGIAILNRDAECFSILEEQAKKCGVQHIKKFGQGKDNEVSLLEYKFHDGTASVAAKLPDGNILNYELGANGKHHALNSLAVITAVISLNGDVIKASAGLKDFTNVKGRGMFKKLSINGKQITLIDDSYNASAISIKAALDVVDTVADCKRKVAVLADIRELGDTAVKTHKGLLDPVKNSSIDKVIAVGPLMRNLFDILPSSMQLAYFEGYKDAIENIDKLVEDSDCVLVKGSLGTRICELVNYLESAE